jgi:scyllo-inositol 2-dehydrogenase (NADP+)
MNSRITQPAHIRGAVIGYGGAFNMGRQHLENLRRHGGTPVAVAEIDPARRAVAEADFPGIATFATVTEMLEKGDANLIIIITPHDSHAVLAKQCLAAGKHVIVEKPMGLTTAECDEMIAAAHAQTLMLSTYHNRHWDGCILEAVRQIRDEQVIGPVHRVEALWNSWDPKNPWWRNSMTSSGGILFDWGVHLLEYSLQILQAPIVEVTGFAQTDLFRTINPFGEDAIEAEAEAVVRFADDAWLRLNVSAVMHDSREAGIFFHGALGTYHMQMGTWKTTTLEDSVQTIRKGQNPPSQGDLYYQNIVQHLSHGEPLVITPEWARRPIHIIDLAMRSARERRALPALHP